MRKFVIAAAIVAALGPGLAADVGGLPQHIGECARTSIKSIGERLVDGQTNAPIPGSGSAVSFVNGASQVSYEQIAAVDNSRRGDPVRLCLASIPQNCPPGDNRGRKYRTANLRTHQSWLLPDSEHSCGGA